MAIFNCYVSSPEGTSRYYPPAGPVGALFTALCGSAELWEFTALLALPGAVPQQLHCDVAGDAAAAPPLVTAFVALQRVEREMGPT